MPRTNVGKCPACGAALRAKEHGLHATMPFTCRCGWHGQIHVDEAAVARGAAVRSQRVAARKQRYDLQRRKSVFRKLILFGASLACLALGAVCRFLPLAAAARSWLAVACYALGGILAVVAVAPLLLAGHKRNRIRQSHRGPPTPHS